MLEISESSCGPLSDNPQRNMKYRKARIARSGGWGLLAVLLCVLWVRSYRWRDCFSGPISATYGVAAASVEGRLSFYYDVTLDNLQDQWCLDVWDPSEWLRQSPTWYRTQEARY